MRLSFRSIASVLGVVVTISCAGQAYACAEVGAPSIDPLKAMNYTETDFGRDLVEQTLRIANAIMGARKPYQLAGSWQTLAPADSSVKRVRVFLAAPAAGRDFMVMVPFDCSCIFLQPAVFLKSVARYADRKEMLHVDSALTLAFMLLHEVGHIDHRDLASFEDSVGKHDYNIDPSAQKTKERSADEFAAQAIAQAALSPKDMDGWSRALHVEMNLSNISFNLSEVRILDNFGGTTLCSKFLFADDGITHPNFELRFLTVNDLLQHTDLSAALLSAFEACRVDPPSRVIFRK